MSRYPDQVAAIPDDLKPDSAHGVDIAVVATSKYPEDVLAQLADALAAREEPFTVVVIGRQ